MNQSLKPNPNQSKARLYNLTTLHPNSRLGQFRQSVTLLIIVQPHPPPLIQFFRTNSLVKINAGLIPFQHAPLQPLPSNFQRLPRDFPQQPLPVAKLSILGTDEKVLEVDAWGAAPGGVIGEKKREAGALV